MDEQVQAAITDQLKRRGVDVMTVQDEGREGADDPDVLDRATELSRVLFTRDEDFLVEAASRQRNRRHFPGLIYAHLTRVSLGVCVQDLELLTVALEPYEIENSVINLPFR